MAEIILSPLVALIVTKTADLALEQVALRWTLKEEIRKLKGTVTTIQAVVLDAETKQTHNHQVKIWLQKLLDVMYDVDDLLDELSTTHRKAAAARTEACTCWSVVCFLLSPLPKLWNDLKMAHDIKGIRKKLDAIQKDRGFHLDELTEMALPSWTTDSCPPIIVVGREVDKNNVIHLLVHTNCAACISVVPIVGIGGLGKTTLAQLVFNDKEVETCFEIKAWVYVSQSFDIEAILRKMLLSLSPASRPGSDLDFVQRKIQKMIKDKKFLFVLDDVWDETVKSWEDLGKYLMVGAPGSKVLVTTRSTRVAEASGTVLKPKASSNVVLPYHLQPLSTDESWDLMVEKAHGKVFSNPDLVTIAKKILEKCQGVPLAISTIASVLIDSLYPEIDWPLFLQKELPMIAGEQNSIMSTLQLSFYQLPSPTKHCFIYCKLFPKGFQLDVQRLVKYWIAQGYIESEEKGLQCSRMLWWRSFFQDVKVDELGNMLTCRMHDLMYDLAGLLTGTKISRSCSPTILKRVPLETRHLAILGQDDGGIVHETNDGGDESKAAKKVRTLVSDKQFSREECKHIVDNFRRVRVLTMAIKDYDMDAYRLLNYVGQLKHLRYFGICFNLVVDLPDCVTDMVNLQVLDLSKFGRLNNLPQSLRKLVSLKHLLLDPFESRYLTHMPEGIGELKSLQTLPIFVVCRRSNGNDEMLGAAGLDELEGLDALRGELVIIYLEFAKFLGMGVYILKNKLHLRSLVLDWSGPADWCRASTNPEILEITLRPPPNLKKLDICGGYRGVKIPDWLSSLSYLVEFTLKDCKECTYVPPLHQLPFLKHLRVKSCPQLKAISFGGYDHYNPSSDSSKATGEKEENEQWPCFICLANLYIKDCPNLIQIPTFPTLDGELELDATSLEPLEKTMKISGGDVIGYPFAGRPLSKLTKLTLTRANSLDSLPEGGWSSLSSLQELKLFSLIGCVMLPNSLCSITRLTDIEISSGSLEYLPSLHLLPSLATLVIQWCPMLKGWWKKGNNGDDDRYYYHSSSTSDGKEEKWPHFPCLSRLRIRSCPKLTQMPLFPTVNMLELMNTSSQALLRTMKMKVAAASSSSSSFTGAVPDCALSKLTYLVIEGINDFESFPEEGFSNLTSLRVLKIVDCRRLSSLPRAIRHIASLKRLEIQECPFLTARLIEGYGADWPNVSHIPDKQF